MLIKIKLWGRELSKILHKPKNKIEVNNGRPRTNGTYDGLNLVRLYMTQEIFHCHSTPLFNEPLFNRFFEKITKSTLNKFSVYFSDFPNVIHFQLLLF